MTSVVRPAFFVALASLAVGASAQAQVVYYGAMRPVVAAPVAMAPAYVANYTPAGNYAAVTAYSPPVVAAPAAIAVTSAYAPSYAAPVGVTSYYAPSVVAAPAVAAPVTAYYPGVVYRRGLFGAYRPWGGYYIPY